MKLLLAVFLAASSAAAQSTQPPSFRPLHVSAGGIIENDSGQPVFLRGLNRSGTGSGNADATATDQDYAAQNQLLSMNVVRIFVNATWWNNNVQVPIANLGYQSYIDGLIQRAKKYGNYVLVLKAGQFPDAPCGASSQNCPAPNQGDLNCQANSSLCLAQDTTGNNIDAAFSFWTAFAKQYAADPAILYDTWEDMHGIDSGTWSDNENQLIATIRTYSSKSLIFVEDTGTAFESITAGTLPDLAWANVVWNFHLYNPSTNTCTEPASPRYTNWSQNFDALVSYARQNGHGVAITEWGGCNDSEPYNTNITSYANLHSIPLIYFDNTYLITQSSGSYQLTSVGSKVAQAFTAIAADGSTPAPVLTSVVTAFSNTPAIAPNTWVALMGSNLAPSGGVRYWLGSDFFGGQMPDQLDGVSATVNGTTAYVCCVSPAQVNILTPPNAILGPVQVTLSYAGLTSNTISVTAQPLSLSFFSFASSSGQTYVEARHGSDNTFIGPTSLFPGLTTPAKPNETIVLAANGFGVTSSPVVAGSVTQSGTLAPLPTIKIGGVSAMVLFAGLSSTPGVYQFNVIVPSSIADGDQPITATYNGQSTQPGVLITIQH